MEGPGNTVLDIAAHLGAVVRASARNILIARYIVSCRKEALARFLTTINVAVRIPIAD